ncbi:hypothetical protein L210DRAFT_3468878 [Boletus edulis BED1]|uniref:Uncharacterized protein n=1 Tax=Boletus edulis BED1 TaxID=1328754 RepID=A0AAD4C9X0_BOLED|nr:hypothetical protein L210DRAFT_3468878 [Boletus edulis BED1]
MVHAQTWSIANKSPQPPDSPQRRRKRPSVPRTSLKVIEQLKEAGKETHLKAANTKRCYAGHVKRGREWLTEFFNGTTPPEDLPWLPPGPEQALVSQDGPDPYADPAFAHAFNSTPNEYSDKALSLYLTYKGFHQDLRRNTVEGVRAAFKDVWDRADSSGHYRGKWHRDQLSQCWEGNPAESSEVDDIMRSLKHKASSEDGDRAHSLPMTAAFMEKMLAWSFEICPSLAEATRALKRAFDDMSSDRTVPALKVDLRERALLTRHLEQLAFDTTAWTLWTRQAYNLTAVNHVVKKYLLDEKLVGSDLTVHFDIRLTNRKGWQRKADKGGDDLDGNHYQLYPQPHLPGSDSFLWLSVWMGWLEVYHYERELDPDNCIFPSMGANGVLQPRDQLSHDTIQMWINEATAGAGIRGSFSTHCFRRGGAQYRFMFAPIGERWTLARVRWWGGWAENEQHDTLIRYLLDELHMYETDHSNTLASRPQNANESLMGEHSLVQPVTTEEVRSMMASVEANISDLRTQMGHVKGVVDANTSDLRDQMVHVKGTVQDLVSVVCTKVPLSGTTNIHHTNSANLNLSNLKEAPSQTKGLTIKIPPLAAPGTSTATRRRNTAATAAITRLSPGQACNSTPISMISNNGQTTPSTSRLATRTAGGHRRTSLSRSLPTAGVVIPDVPMRNPNGSRRPKCESWRDIVKHWTEGDPALGLHTPLRDWPPEWTRHNNRLFAVKYHQRSLIALEFLNTYRSDETRFLAAYPEAAKGHTALFNAINLARQARGEREVRA